MLENMKFLGRGNTAEVFEYGNEKVCKLFFEGYPDEYAALEFQNAREMYKNKIRISKPFQMITIGNRKGIIYERIEGRTLLNIMMENETNLDMLLNTFVNLQLNILSHHTKNVLSYKEYLIAILKSKKINNQVILNTINVLPDDDCLLHGDLHPNNILVMSDGTPVIIDFMNVCRGPVQTATFCGQQGRISRTVRAILSGQPGISAGQRVLRPTDQYYSLFQKKAMLSQSVQ